MSINRLVSDIGKNSFRTFLKSLLIFRETLMEKCDFSELTIPNDPAYTAVATSYVRQVAAKLGFDETDQEMIRTAVAEAVGNVIEHAFEPRESADFRISCERAPLGLRIVVKDKGMPAGPELLECVYDANPAANQCKGISLMRECVDEVEFNNQGPDGKEIVLVKYLRNRDVTDYFQTCNLEPYALPGSKSESGQKIEFTVREMEPSEAVEISRTVYRAYGYSYAYEHAYYPDRLTELVRNGKIYIAVAVTASGEIAGVAVTASGEIAGHCALIKKDQAPRIAELGLGAVKPRFKSQRVFTQLTEHLIRKADAEGLMGVFGEAVTNHTFSQKTGLSLGLRDCALMVGYVPATVSFKGITEQLPNRVSLLVHFLYIHKPQHVTIHPPLRHKEMILKLYGNVGMSPEIGDSPVYVPEPLEAVVTTTASRTKDSAEIYIRRFAPNIVPDIKARLKELCRKRIDIMHLYMNLEDPGTAEYCSDFEEMGFFFSGILPGGMMGDALILQYLNNVSIDYDKINVASEAAKDLVSYVRRFDPNVQTPQMIVA
jgi:anti-sigma regulatory factor (Ser/Thr protein kinase)